MNHPLRSWKLRQPVLVAILACTLLAGCASEQPYPNRPITLVCPWNAGGGTDSVSRQIASYLERELDVPVNVVNATGGKGVTGHSRIASASPDGYTIGMATVELNMMHWTGLTDLSYEDCTPLMSLNEDYAALFVRSDSPWHTLADLEAAIREQPGELRGSGTVAGGIWHVAVAGWLTTAGFTTSDLTWIGNNGASPSLAELRAEGIQIVSCSLPEAATDLKNGDIRALGVMAPQRSRDYPDVPTFAEQGRDWSLGGWRGLMMPPGAPKEVTDRLHEALFRIVTGETTIPVTLADESGTNRVVEQSFPEFMAAQGFDATWREPEQFRELLSETEAKFAQLMTSEAMQAVNRDRYNAMAYPGVLFALLGITTLSLVVPAALARRGAGNATTGTAVPTASDALTEERARPTTRGVVSCLIIMASVAAFPLLAETVGFVLLCGSTLFVMLWWLGSRWWVSGLIAGLVTPAIYMIFGALLRVPLPRGWWGW